MTNLVAALIISTNSHWTLVETKPSNYGCLVYGCKRDHSEMRLERKDTWRITQARILFDGVQTNFVLKCESIGSDVETRIQYSGVDYEKEPSRLMSYTNQWVIPTYRDAWTWTNWPSK